TAVSLLMYGSALWLRRFKYSNSFGRRQAGVVVTLIPTLISALVMWEYARDVDLGIDLIVFPETLTKMWALRPGRPSPGTAVSLFMLGLALLCVDAKSKRVQRISEVAVLFVALLGAVRMIGFVFGEVGMYAPSWQIFGMRVFKPMSPTTASGICATAIAVLFARPRRCAVRFLLMAGPAGIVVRSLIPAALILPVVLGWLGLLVIRGGLVDTQYPLSLVVAAMIVLLLAVISMNARAIRRIHDAQLRLTAILDATPDFVGIADVHGQAIYVNHAGRIMTGVDDAEITALTIPDFHPVDAAHRLMKEGVPAAIREGVWTGETELMSGNGEHIPVSQVILAHKDSSGEVAYLSTIMRDITHQKRLEDSQRFLLDATRVFSGSLESDAILISLLKLVVPHYADYCVIDLMGEDGRIHRAALSFNRGPDLRERLRLHPTGKKPNPVIAQVVRSGEPLIVPEVTAEWLSGVMRGRPHPTLLQKIRPRSTMIVPMLGRRHMLGVICYSVTQSAKRYAEQDMQLARELAGRVAL
ncbi:MAG TPA: PAS domain-containing protein, partial [Longimicrobiales bacterium]